MQCASTEYFETPLIKLPQRAFGSAGVGQKALELVASGGRAEHERAVGVARGNVKLAEVDSCDNDEKVENR